MQEEKLMFSDCIIINRELFFVETRHGLPAKMNLDTGVVSYCDTIENFMLQKGDIIYSMCICENKVYALAASGKTIIIFDLEKLQCQYIPLQCAYRKWGNFIAFEQYGTELYIFPRYENKIFIMNVINNEITEIADYFDGMTELQCACRNDDKIWLLPCNNTVIGCYNFANGEMRIYELKKKIENCVSSVFANGYIYMLNRFGIIYAWNIDEFILGEVKVLETGCSGEKSMFGKMIYAGGKLVILPSLSDDIKLLNLSDGSVEIYDDYPEDFLYYDIAWSKYAGSCEDNNYYYCAMRRENYLLKINKQDGTLSWIKPNIPLREERIKIQDPLEEKRMEGVFATREQFCVEEERDIGRFLDKISKKRVSCQSSSTGKLIFEKMKY